MVTCAICQHRAHEGVCVTCINEYEDDKRKRQCVCVTPNAPSWVNKLTIDQGRYR